MPFEKGHNKSGGRKPGSKNRKTEVANAFMEYIVDKGYKDWDNIWKELRGKDKADAILKAVNYLIPQQARVENRNKIPTEININLIPASKERIAENNTIDISHEEIDDKNE